MQIYQPRIRFQANGRYYAQVVYIQHDGKECVVPDFKRRSFATLEAAERTTAKYIAEQI